MMNERNLQDIPKAEKEAQQEFELMLHNNVIE